MNKVQEGHPDIVDEMRNGRIAAGFQYDRGRAGDRRQFQPAPHRADPQYPYYTTVAGARAAVQAIGALRQGCLEVAPSAVLTFDRLSGMAARNDTEM